MKKIIFDENFTIAIIGFGRFGKLLTSVLSKNCQSKIVVVSSNKHIHLPAGVILGGMEDIKKADMVIPCIPISVFESVMERIGELVKKDTIVMDICSVKVNPVRWMKKRLPKSVQMIASHPMFGPDSYELKRRMNDLRFVIYNINAEKGNYQVVKKFFEDIKWKIIELSPKKHDEFMAKSLAYSYLIGKIGQRMAIKQTPIDTHDFQLLLDHMAIVKSDSEQLFIDMQTQNPYAASMQKKVKNIFLKLFKDFY